MILKNRYLHILVVLLTALLSHSKVQASHAMGMDLEYKCLGLKGVDSVRYEVIIRYYRDCSGIPASTTVPLDIACSGGGTRSINIPLSNTSTPPPGTQVSQLCPVQLDSSGCKWTGSGTAPYPGVEVYIYPAIITVPLNCGQITLSTDECCRNTVTNIQNSGSIPLTIFATINQGIDPNTGQLYCNNSATFTSMPVPFFCAGSQATFNHGVVDADGDSLVFELMTPIGTYPPAFNPALWEPGYSQSQPIKTLAPDTFRFDPRTGQMQFTPAQTEKCAIAVRVYEYRNGVLVGSTMRDIQMVVINCAVSIPRQDSLTNLQSGNKLDSITIRSCPGTQLQFDVVCTDPARRTLTLESNLTGPLSPLPGATLTAIGTGDTVTARITWTPAVSDSGCHTFILTAKNDDCPINGSVTRAYNVCVFYGVSLLSSDPTFCGRPVRLSATGGSNFTWSPTAGPNAVSNPNVLNPVVSPATSTMYYFTSDCGTDSVFINVDPPFAFDAGANVSICANGKTQLNASIDNMYPPYSFTWTPTTALLDPIYGTPNDSILNPVAGPLATTKYVLKVTGANGCTLTDSVTVNVTGNGPPLTAGATPQQLCLGDQVQLQAIPNPPVCGVNQPACTGNVMQGQLGTGTTYTPTNNATTYPTIYGRRAISARHQFIYRASELLTQFPSGGEIRSISFYVKPNQQPDDTLYNFEIKMACAQGDAFPLSNAGGWETNLATVSAAKTVYAGSAPGWKTHTLDFPYTWDGVSNLVVDICFYMPPPAMGGMTLNAQMQMTPTPFNSVYFSTGNIAQCGQTGNPKVSVNRPNTRFDMCVTDISALPIAWTPATGPNAPTPTNTVNPVARPQSSQVYNVSVTGANQCVSTDYVYVEVDTSLRMSAFPADTFFCNPPANGVQLTTRVIGVPKQGQQFSYQWRDITNNVVVGAGPTITANPNPTGTTRYVLRLTGGVCELTDTVNIVINSVSAPVTVTPITCNGSANGKIKVIAAAGATYAWSNNVTGVDSITNLGPGSYTVTVTYSPTCQVTASATLSDPPPFSISAAGTNVTCFGAADGRVVVTPAGGTAPYSYLWSPAQVNNNTAIGLSAGTYNVTATDSAGCTATATASITEPTAISTQVSVTHVSCYGLNDGSADLTVVGGTPPLTYNWTGGLNIEDLPAAAAGQYYVTVTDASGCGYVDSATINQPTAIVLTLGKVDPLCSGDGNGAVWVSATCGAAPYTYNWYKPNGSYPGSNDSLSGLVADRYYINVIDATQCTTTDSIDLISPVTLDAQLINKNEISCANAQDGSVEVLVSGGTPPIAYTWDNAFNSSTPAIAGLAPGTYTVTVTDVNGCDTVLSTTFNAPPLISVFVATADSVTCPGYTDGNIHISGVGGTPGATVPYEYSVDGVTYQSSEYFTALAAGVYQVYIRDSEGCQKDTTLLIGEPTKLVFTLLPGDTMVDLGTSINLTSALSNYNEDAVNFYSWSPITGLNCGDCKTVTAIPYFNTTYTLTVNYRNNCSVSQNVSVLVGNGDDFFVPNAFSPNGDGNNDVLEIYATGLASAKLKIFNRWGEKVFDSSNQWLGWDGSYKGAIQNPGVYSYVVEAVYLNGDKREKKGTITLVK